ncbi:hypothetical protein Cantr_07480 [Candida viswanathii]|uniref:Uncharacterized protein n=1 Tax=Candida viswanathii TaxID=5486 RepID=A0A367Y2C1_9ASCO|nr:hypothetical protein Cantr_07480 [Candida viswanathii]
MDFNIIDNTHKKSHSSSSLSDDKMNSSESTTSSSIITSSSSTTNTNNSDPNYTRNTTSSNNLNYHLNLLHHNFLKSYPPPALTSLPLDIPLQIKEVAPGDTSFSSTDTSSIEDINARNNHFAMIFNNSQLKRKQSEHISLSQPPPILLSPVKENDELRYKKIDSPMSDEFFFQDNFTLDFKFQYQQSIIEFLNYIIGKYKEMESSIRNYQHWWNVYTFKRQTLDNLIEISNGFKQMIISILKQLSINSGIIKGNNNNNTTTKTQFQNDEDLINYNVFQFVYNCSIENINIGHLINTSLFSNAFKFNLLSYYYKLNYLLINVKDQKNWLVIPMEIWYKLPSFIKIINDNLMKINKPITRDLEITLVKLNSITTKFPIVDNLKKTDPINSWSDFEKINLLISSKFPDYALFNSTQQFSDFVPRPLSTANDIKVIHMRKVVNPPRKVENSPSGNTTTTTTNNNTNHNSTTLGRASSLKRSLSKIVKRSLSTNDAKERCENPNESPIVKLETNTPKQPPQRHQSLQEHLRRLKLVKTPKREDLVLSNKQHPPLPKNAVAQSQQPSIRPTIERYRSINGRASAIKKVDNSAIQYQLDCLVQFRKRLFQIGPQLLEFLHLQLNYCKSWESLLEQNELINNSSNHDDPYIKSIYQSFHEKLLNQIEFTKLTIILHIADRLIIPIDECLKLCDQGKGDPINVNKFMELIVAQYNKLYCQWLEGIIGPRSIKEYQDLCSKIGKTNGEDIIQYYDQLTKLKSLVM